MVGVADIDAHRQRQQSSAADIVLRISPHDLPTDSDVLRSEQADNGDDQQVRVAFGYPLGASFHGLLVHHVMRLGGQRRRNPVHTADPNATPLLSQPRLPLPTAPIRKTMRPSMFTNHPRRRAGNPGKWDDHELSRLRPVHTDHGVQRSDELPHL